jgi:hypothetical protein
VNHHQNELQRAIQLNKAVRPAAAYENVLRLIEEADLRELESVRESLNEAMASFLPKRRRALEEALADRIANLRRASELSETAAQFEDMPAVSNTTQEAETAGSQHWQPSADYSDNVESHNDDPADDEEHSQDALSLVHSQLDQVRKLNFRVMPAEAEKELESLIDRLSSDELIDHLATIESAISDFLPKRQNRLKSKLKRELDRATVTNERVSGKKPDTNIALPNEGRNSAEPEPESADRLQSLTPAAMKPRVEKASPSVKPTTAHVRGKTFTYNRRRFNEDLDLLSRRHIFKWNTQYRDTLTEYFDAFLDELTETSRPQPILDLARSALGNHSRDIFEKGYEHSTRNGLDESAAVDRTLTGLHRFLDIPLEIYSTKLPAAHQNNSLRSLRQLTSAMLLGICGGYSWTDLSVQGSQLISQNLQQWCYILPFLTYGDLQELAGRLDPNTSISRAVRDSLLPLAEALDTFIEDEPSIAPLPALCEYAKAADRLDISLQIAPAISNARRLDVRCYVASDQIASADLEDASARACVVLAPLAGDLYAHVASVQRLADIVIQTGANHTTDVSGRIREILEDQVYQQKVDAGPNRPIVYNSAQEFPIDNPFLAKYQHVYRKSVRQLMSTFERRNGVRLWCSVRRSGKTTACAIDLDATGGGSVFVPQSCSSTGQIEDGDVFYKRVVATLNSGGRIGDDFVMSTVRKTSRGQYVKDKRIILVLDEYELLFGQLRAWLRREPDVRYTVVQPLLDQLVAFTRDNLLVFMGQQPDAHFIMMDQNQLSPVVVQDAFPLFPHNSVSPLTTEFAELVRKVLRSGVDVESGFVDAVYMQTGGHPFLTVNLLVAFIDWLIAEHYPRSALSPLKAETFVAFREQMLTRKAVARSPHFNVFKAIAKSALSVDSVGSDPWLNAIYTMLRALDHESPTSHVFSYDEFMHVASLLCPNSDADELLGSGVRSNFLTFEDHCVRPKIPLLAQITGAVNPGPVCD